MSVESMDLEGHSAAFYANEAGKPSDMEDRMEFPTGGRGEKAKGAWNDEN